MSPTSLTPGTRLGPFEIIALLGVGGMGEVYRATDTGLKRQVAIKVLPASLAADADRLARFQREAECLAVLNHTNIAHIHGLERFEGTIALVMELVEGPTLADRIAQGAIPLDEALSIATQIAEALETAHEQGIVHRDLKPANIKVRRDGTVKVLDFGLARAMDPAASSADAMNSPTISVHATQAGTILGTAAYMSPEQTQGRATDRRSDIWAFGCVLYEMLAGRRAFPGESVAEIMSEVLKSAPDFGQLPATTPDRISLLVRQCLHKDRRERLQHIGDARLAIRDARTEPRAAGPVTSAGTRERLAWIVTTATLALVAVGAVGWAMRSTTRTPHEMRFEITTPPTSDPSSLAISPDGRQVVFSAMSEGRSRLWLRSLESGTTEPLTESDDGFYPFWSPDNRSIGFFANGWLKRKDLDGGLVRELARAPNPLGGTWNLDGTILFAPNFTGPLFRASGTGVSATVLTRVDPAQTSHRFPQALPDGRHFLYYVTGALGTAGVYVGQLDGAGRRLLEADSTAVYAASGHLLFVRHGTLFAQAFDPATLALSGSPVPIADQIALAEDSNAAGLSASAAGPFVYRSGHARTERQLTWVDRSGRALETVGDRNTSVTTDCFALSPDGRRLALTRGVNANADVWMLDLLRGLLSRVTSDIAADICPVWSPDGRRIVFTSDRTGVYELYEISATSGGSETLFLATQQNKAPSDWSSDGRFVLYRSPGATTGFDEWAVPVEAPRTPIPVAQTSFEEREGQFSPNGKWVAYQSNESGRVEIYVQPFPGPGRKQLISTAGGAQVRWRRDGRELFYITLDGQLMAVPIGVDADHQAIDASAPVPLFATHVGGAVQGLFGQTYIPSPDGQRFLMNTVVEEATSPITVIIDWSGRSK